MEVLEKDRAQIDATVAVGIRRTLKALSDGTAKLLLSLLRCAIRLGGSLALPGGAIPPLRPLNPA